MSKLILHIGHGKTGTSYIQSALSLNQDYLKSKGIYYPPHKSFEFAKQGFATSGNGELIFKKDFMPTGTTLLSDEGLCHRLSIGDNFEKFISQRNVELSVVLYSRNLIEFQSSGYFQYIQAGLGKCDFNDYVLLNRIPYASVLWWLKKSNELGFDLVFRNYSNHKNDLLKRFFSDLSVDIDFADMNAPTNELVNRSLNVSEALLISTLYASIGADVKYFADRLINDLPNVKSQKPKISEGAYNHLLSQSKATVDEINSMVSIDEHISLENFSTYNSNAIDFEETDFCTLTKDQCVTLSQALAEFSMPRNSILRELNNTSSFLKILIKKLLRIPTDR